MVRMKEASLSSGRGDSILAAVLIEAVGCSA